jgi:hypothetical protein
MIISANKYVVKLITLLKNKREQALFANKNYICYLHRHTVISCEILPTHISIISRNV